MRRNVRPPIPRPATHNGIISWRTVLSDPTPPKAPERSAFRTAGGEFAKGPNGHWTETGSRGERNHLRETNRTREYIQMYDAARNLSVRIYADRGEWWTGQTWVRWPGSEGRWAR